MAAPMSLKKLLGHVLIRQYTGTVLKIRQKLFSAEFSGRAGRLQLQINNTGDANAVYGFEAAVHIF